MSQSLAKLNVHLVFSTKNRQRVFLTPQLRESLTAYIVGIFRNLDCPSMQTGVVTDHVHVLFIQSRTDSLSDIVGKAKRATSEWLKQQEHERKDPRLIKFHWQDGYGAFSVSESMVDAVKEYIGNQEEHHKRMTFQEEYRKLLEKHNVTFDERYVWE